MPGASCLGPLSIQMRDVNKVTEQGIRGEVAELCAAEFQRRARCNK
jgi:hypothetical protein